MSRLAEMESIIEHGLATFIEVGRALRVIRDDRLYPQQAFENYCRERWGMSPQRARHLMDAAEIATHVAVSNEAEARPLATVLRQRGADAVIQAYEAAAAAGPVNGPSLRRAAQAVLHPITFAPEAAPNAAYQALLDKLDEVAQLAATLDGVLMTMTQSQHERLRASARRVDRKVIRRLDADRHVMTEEVA